MGHRTGTPMRLVSPAPVLVPGAGPRQQAPPTIYQPQQPQGTQQTIYSQQNNSNVGGKRLELPTLSSQPLTPQPIITAWLNYWQFFMFFIPFFMVSISMEIFVFLNNWTQFRFILEAKVIGSA